MPMYVFARQARRRGYLEAKTKAMAMSATMTQPVAATSDHHRATPCSWGAVPQAADHTSRLALDPTIICTIWLMTACVGGVRQREGTGKCKEGPGGDDACHEGVKAGEGRSRTCATYSVYACVGLSTNQVSRSMMTNQVSRFMMTNQCLGP